MEKHFKNLQGKYTEVTDEPITKIINNHLDIKQFMPEDLDVRATKIKNEKAAGLNEIPLEVWKTRKFDDRQLRYCNTGYSQKIIDRWTKYCFLPSPKKGNLGIVKDYRVITFTSIVAKIYYTLILNRTEHEIKEILKKNQNNFWKNRSTSSQF